jgi:hypothetical protein
MEEVYVWVETYTDAVDEQYRESCAGGMWSVPVSELFGGRAVRAEESKGSRREDVEARPAIELERIASQIAGCDNVNDNDTLERS